MHADEPRRARPYRGRRAGALLALACAASAGCARAPAPEALGRPVEGLPRGPIAVGGGAGSPELFRPVPLEVSADAPSLVAVRLTLVRGAVDVVALAGDEEVSRRRVERTGDDLVILPVRRVERGKVRLAARRPTGTGPLDVEFERATLYRVAPASASATAAEIGAAFERETGRVADPVDENLVANPDFATDDEVRGTPADWFAYVDTESDPPTHTLHVAGAPPPSRPMLATGPMRVARGRRYRASWRMTVERGSVGVRIVDYDELVTVAAAEPAPAGAGPLERAVEFTVPAGVRAVRLRFEPATAGADAAFNISEVAVEALPEP